MLDKLYQKLMFSQSKIKFITVEKKCNFYVEIEKKIPYHAHTVYGQVAEWLCRGLQILGCRFDSDPGLHLIMIKNIVLTNFRNHKMSRIKTSGAKNVIVIGENGAGKTAILEALSMLSGDRGMRGADMMNVARFDGNGSFSVFAEMDDDTNISVYFNNGDTNRHAKIDDENATLSGLNEKIKMVWLSPREDRLFVDGVSERRAFFDRLCCGFDSKHAGRVARLSKLISERAYALKSGGDKHLLDVLDDSISSMAIAVCDTRIKYAGAVNYFLDNYAISLTGMIEEMIISGATAGDAERKYREYLGKNRDLVADKMVIDGPHKSDFGMFNKTLNLPVSLTSTGQQKMALLDLILAHTKLLHSLSECGAIVLLDEAVAHLDNAARESLFDALGKTETQVWATGIEREMFGNIKNAIFVTCQDGEIKSILNSDE